MSGARRGHGRRARWVAAAVVAGLTLLSGGRNAQACDVALMLAVDVSGSVDQTEYRLQMHGLANALVAPEIADALVGAGAVVSLMQWSGTGRQRVSIPWRRIATLADVDALAASVRATPRVWRDFSTGIGEALALAASQFTNDAADCRRRIVDVSGDGRSNEGPLPAEIHPRLAALGVTVNGLAIEGSEPNLTQYFETDVILGPGAFVVTANGYGDYARAIRLKLWRELTTPIAQAEKM